MTMQNILMLGTSFWLLSTMSLTNAATLTISSATDWGGTVSGFPASNAIDGSTSWASRWVASTAVQTGGVSLVLDLGSDQDVTDVDIAWGHGDDYTHRFEIRSLVDGGSSSDWIKVLSSTTSSGTTESYENYDITDVVARYIRIKVFENSDSDDEQMIKEVKLYDNGSSPTSPVTSPTSSPVTSPVSSSSEDSVDYGLSTSVPPSGNFDLLGWYLSYPEEDNDGEATEVKENDLDGGFSDTDYFYTSTTDGAMVFKTPCEGVTTSPGTDYLRTELREMIRRGDTSYTTDGKENNWAFSSIPSSDQSAFGGIDGVMEATLAVNHVTTTGSSNFYNGRIVIGQIHAKKDEPCRLYYHKLPNNSKGAIYVAHEPSDSGSGSETFYNLLGSMVDSDGDISSSSNPSAGIELNEIFKYSIVVVKDDLTVTISSESGTQLAQEIIPMDNSGYDDSDNYMYYKAGIYLQDDTCSSSDYAEVSFYELTYSHD